MKINPRQIIDQNVKTKITKLLEENIKKNLHGLNIGKEFLKTRKKKALTIKKT
jgi:hypothetical protein